MSLEWKSEGVMDDESGEFMERAELVSVGRSQSEMESELPHQLTAVA